MKSAALERKGDDCPPTPGGRIDPHSPLWQEVLFVHRLAETYWAGASLEECGRDFGLSLGRVRYRLQRAGVPRRRRGRPRGPADEARLRRRTLRAVGQIMGCSKQNVHRLLRDAARHRGGLRP